MSSLSDLREPEAAAPEESIYLRQAQMSERLKSYDECRGVKPTESACARCIAMYQDLYKKGQTSSPMPPHCKGPYSELGGATRAKFMKGGGTDQEWFLFRSMHDPIEWAKTELSWVTEGYDTEREKDMDRWYQKEMLDCSSQFKTYRIGRRAGKTDTLCIEALWPSYQFKNNKVLVIAPFEAQVKLIFKRIDELLAQSSTMGEMVVRRVHGPEYIEFRNGSTIQGFSSNNNSSGTGANKIRGQSANVIILDESDLLADADIEAISAILASDKNCRVFEASTPTGRRSNFWQNCTDKNLGYKEFHYHSHVSPEFSRQVDAYFRKKYSYDGYLREFLAEFGDEATGVFSKDAILFAVGGENVEQLRARGPQPGWRYVLGVDWNGREKGTHIIAMGLDPTQERYVVVDKQVIRQERFTQDAAVKTVIHMFDYWRAHFVYVDHGYGEAQVEMLEKFAVENNHRRLLNGVVAIPMQGKRTIVDPATGLDIEKDTKPWIVNLTAMKLERGTLLLPSEEEYRNDSGWGLTAQMLAFHIKGTTTTGKPIYSQDEDHTLTACMLCVLAFMEKMTDMSDHAYDPGVAFRPHKEGTDMSKVREERQLQVIKMRRNMDDSFGAKIAGTPYYDGSKITLTSDHGPMIKKNLVTRPKPVARMARRASW